MAEWVKKLPAAEQDAYLMRFLAEEGDLPLRAEMVLRLRDATEPRTGKPVTKRPRRIVAQLFRARDALAENRRLIASKRATKEKAERDRENAKERARYIDNLAGREAATCRAVSRLIAARNPTNDDRAIILLLDLCEMGRERVFRRKSRQKFPTYGPPTAPN